KAPDARLVGIEQRDDVRDRGVGEGLDVFCQCVLRGAYARIVRGDVRDAPQELREVFWRWWPVGARERRSAAVHAHRAGQERPQETPPRPARGGHRALDIRYRWRLGSSIRDSSSEL